MGHVRGAIAPQTSIEIVGRALSRDALLLSRVAAPADAEIARQFVSALRDPKRVALFLGLPDKE